MATRMVATTDQTKAKVLRESSRRPGPGVRSTLGVTKSTRKRVLLIDSLSLSPSSALILPYRVREA